jgi:hypothetical protein
LRQYGHAFTTPTRDVWDEDIAIEMQFGFVEKDPTSGTTSASMEWTMKICSQA